MKQSYLYARLCIVLIATLAFIAACANQEPLVPPTADERTQLAFKRNCAVCHGATGEGQTLGASIVPSLRDGRALANSNEYLKQQIVRGGNGMPPFANQLSSGEIDNLVHYIRTELQSKTARSE